MMVRRFYFQYIIIVCLLLTGFVRAGEAEDSQEESYIFNNAVIYYINRDFQPALYTLKRLQNSQNEELAGSSYFLSGKIYQQVSENERAQEQFSRAKVFSFSLKDALLFEMILATASAQTHRQPPGSVEELLALNPESPFCIKALEVKADAQVASENFAAADITFARLNKFFPHSSREDVLLYKWGNTLEKCGKISEAANRYNELIFGVPDSPLVVKARQRMAAISATNIIPLDQPVPEDYLRAALHLAEKNKYTQSSAYLLQLVSKFPWSSLTSNAQLMMAVNKYNNREYSAASALLADFITTNPQHPQQAKAMFYQARVFQTGSANAVAADLYRTITEQYPHSDFVDKALYQLAQMAKVASDDVRCRFYLTRLFQSRPYSTYAPESIWEVGWYYYSSGQWAQAFDTFKLAEAVSSTNELVPKCLFWAAKAAEKKRDFETAEKLYVSLYKKYYYSYYAFLTWTRFSSDPEKQELLKIRPCELMVSGSMELTKDPVARRLELLQNLGYGDEYKCEIKKYEQKGVNAEALQALISSRYFYNSNSYYAGVKNIEDSVNTALKKNTPVTREVLQLSYPKVYWNLVAKYARLYHFDPFLLQALIREESRFNPNARSKSNALGLTQIIPKTALDISNRLKIKLPEENELTQPEQNILMGAYYLSGLLERFNNNFILTLSGYNGGPNITAKWWEARGSSDLDEFAETIPYAESKFYVQKVLKSYWMYKLIYGDEALELARLN